MRRTLIWAGCAAALALSGCGGDDKKDAPAGPTSTVAAQKPTTTAMMPPTRTDPVVAANDDDIPSEVDFEDQAEKEITADNVDSELEKLEKELSQ